jgi:DNA mismatch endonuclease (patch repair protein)
LKTAKLPEVEVAGDSRRAPEALPRLHRGDIMSPEKRSALMSRIRGKNTGPERAVGAIVGALGLEAEFHVKDLPGRPDLVLRALRVAIFVDGDFWHGWRFPAWRRKLSEKWELKIAANRRRDALNHARLRRAGWLVIRIWEHQVDDDPDGVTAKLRKLLAGRPSNL